MGALEWGLLGSLGILRGGSFFFAGRALVGLALAALDGRPLARLPAHRWRPAGPTPEPADPAARGGGP